MMHIPPFRQRKAKGWGTGRSVGRLRSQLPEDGGKTMIGKRALLLGSAIMLAGLTLSSTAQGVATEPFKIMIAPVKNRVQSGSRVELEVVLTNTSDRDLIVSSIYQGLSNDSYEIDVMDGSGTHLKRLMRPDDNGKGLHSFDLRPPVKPNESVKDLVSVTAFFDLTTPGEYTIQLSRQLDEKGPDVKSNAVNVMIVPRVKLSSPQS